MRYDVYTQAWWEKGEKVMTLEEVHEAGIPCDYPLQWGENVAREALHHVNRRKAYQVTQFERMLLR